MLELFFAYSHENEDLRNELEIHLSQLKREGTIRTWHDRRIVAGEELDHEIDEHLENASIILLLVSHYFLGSDYCYDVEMRRAIERHKRGEARVIPVILQPCDWKSAPFGRLLVLPKDGKPVTKYPDQNDAFLEIVQAVRTIANDLIGPRESSSRSTSVAPPTTPPRITAQRPRSSNLRIRHEFTGHARDKFLQDAFEYIANYFEESLKELDARTPEVDVTYQRFDATTFSAAAYLRGSEKTGCTIRYGSHMVGKSITYSHGTMNRGGCNEALHVEDDGQMLFLQPMGMAFGRHDEKRQLSHEGAAELFWGMFMDPMQR